MNTQKDNIDLVMYNLNLLHTTKHSTVNYHDKYNKNNYYNIDDIYYLKDCSKYIYNYLINNNFKGLSYLFLHGYDNSVRYSINKIRCIVFNDYVSYTYTYKKEMIDNNEVSCYSEHTVNINDIKKQRTYTDKTLFKIADKDIKTIIKEEMNTYLKDNDDVNKTINILNLL